MILLSKGGALGIFDDLLEEISRIKSEFENRSDYRVVKNLDKLSWEEGSGLILQEETAVELGDPRLGSLMTLLWCDPSRVEDGNIALVGPDIRHASERKLPLGMIVIAGARFSDEYDCYRALREAVYGVKLKGFMARMMPSRNTIWCRVSKDAISSGFSLFHLGGAILNSLKGVGGVSSAEIVMVTAGKEQVERIRPVVEGARKLVDAMIKMYSEMNFDCETCDYKYVCEEVSELRKIRERLKEKAKDKGNKGK